MSSEDMDALVNPCVKSVSKCTAACNAVPGEKRQDWDLYSTFDGYRKVMQVEREKIEGLMDKLLAWSGIKVRTADLSVQDMMELLSDANDQILDRVNIHLDEASGLRKEIDLVAVSMTQQKQISGSWNRNKERGSAEEREQKVRLLTAKNVSRPQISFKDFIDNSSSPFVPRLKEKPHALKPLSILVEYADDGTEIFSHPYRFEMEALKPLELQLKRTGRREEPKELASTECLMVDTVEKLQTMIDELSTEKLLAVDTEAHSYRSYLGLISLVQNSSRDKDYLIDPFPIWAEMTRLNELFANPKIVKIIHGADSDILWLQRDFSVYIVNLFDTHVAAKMLSEFPSGYRSYAYLLDKICRVTADKKFQLADWRIRPLPEEMVRYARMDTRYLITIYHAMKDRLIDAGNETNNLLRATLDASNDLCKRTFMKPVVSSKSHLMLLRKSGMSFNARQMYALRHLYEWRDRIAREEDESPAFVMFDHMLLKVCTELPREMQGILACCNPTPPLVKQHLQHLHLQILKGREQPLTANPADIEVAPTAVPDAVADSKGFMENPLRCPLDLDPITELTGSQNVTSSTKSSAAMDGLLKSTPSIAAFTSRKSPESGSGRDVKVFLSPYKRYLMLKPYLEYMKSDKEKTTASTDERIQSIKSHFEELTAMTAEEYGAPRENEHDEKEHPSGGEEDDETNERADVLVESEEVVPRVYTDRNAAKKRKKKQKALEQTKMSKLGDAQSTPGAAAAEVIDYENADFRQFANPDKKDVPNNQFNPMAKLKKKAKGGGGSGGKQKQRYKAGGMSMSYKKR